VNQQAWFVRITMLGSFSSIDEFPLRGYFSLLSVNSKHQRKYEDQLVKTLIFVLAACATLLTQSRANAAGIVTELVLTPAQFAAYQSGKTVQNFESVSGVPGWNITNFNNNVGVSTLGGGPGDDLLATWNAAHDGFIVTSGGNTPGGIFNLTGGLTGASSGTHVLAPLGSTASDSTGTENTCFAQGCNNGMAFEFFFSQPVMTVGFFVSGATSFLVGTQNLGITVGGTPANPTILRDFTNSSNYSVNKVDSGTFVTITSTLADITSVSMGFAAGSTPDFIDDVTFSRGSVQATVPEPATYMLAGLALSAFGLRRKRK